MSSKTLRTGCSRDCPDACAILATVEGSTVTRLQGDPDHPITQGFLCHRTSRYLDWQYSPDRLTSPLVRQGDEFQPIGWDEALDRIAEQMLRFRSESGPESIMYHRCGGSMGLLKHVTDYFFGRFGPVTVKSGDVCSGAGEAAHEADFGFCDANDLLDLDNSRAIFLWGKNLYASNVHLIPIVQRARARGAKIVLIDPVSQRTRSLADVYVQPRPGGDAALALGMLRWCLDHHRIDNSAAEYCDHFDTFLDIARSQSIDQWAVAADVSAEQIRTLAEVFVDGPSAILVGWGLQRRTYGATTVRVLDGLSAVTGQLVVPGGGVSFCIRRRGAFDLSSLKVTPTRTIPEPLLGPGILAQRDPPIRMAWIGAANPVAMLPQSNTVAEALRTRELTVVVDTHLTDSARCAHIVLPTTTFLEEDDLLGAYGHHWILEMQAVVPKPDGVRSDYEIVQALATRVGLEDEFSVELGIWKQRLLQRLVAHGLDVEQLKHRTLRNPFAPNVLFENRQFATPTGKVNLITHLPQALCRAAERNVVQLAANSTARAQASQWMPHQQTGLATAVVHPQAVPGFADGDVAWLKSSVGELQVRLQFDDTQRPDIILMDKGGWLHRDRCANALVPAQVTDAGEGANYYDVPVRIEPSADGRE